MQSTAAQNPISSPSQNSVGFNPEFTSALPGGLDLMTSVQVLLVKNYDEQLAGIKDQMESALAVKQQYRKDIEALQKLLTKKSEKIDDAYRISLDTPEEKDILRKESDYQPNLEAEPGESRVQDHSTQQTWGEFNANTIGKDGKTWVKKEQVESKLEGLQQKLEGINEQSEITSIQLQSLTNQRKIAFETLSQLVRKQHETLGTMVRNLQS